MHLPFSIILQPPIIQKLKLSESENSSALDFDSPIIKEMDYLTDTQES